MGPRGWNRHPDGGLSGLGTSPFTIARERFVSTSTFATVRISANVTGHFG
jgi:hypothetical protein